MAGRIESAASESRDEQTIAAPDRRVATRRCLHLQADITLPGDLTIVGHTMDISAGGISVEVPYMLEFGQECLVELDLSALGGPVWLQLTAEVRHCGDAANGLFRAGLQFVNADPLFTELFEGLW